MSIGWLLINQLLILFIIRSEVLTTANVVRKAYKGYCGMYVKPKDGTKR